MKRKFTPEEVEFLYELLKHRIESPEGCHVPGTNIMCPYWEDLSDDPTDDAPGRCTMTKSKRVCTKLQLPLVDEDLVLEVRAKKTQDRVEELENQLKDAQASASRIAIEMRDLNTQRQELLQQIEQIKNRKDKLLGVEENDEFTDDDESTDSEDE